MASAFSYAQLASALWAEPGSRVHALVDGSVLPGLPGRLSGADVLGWDCLSRGALSADAAQRAPYLVELRDGAPFTGWLLGEATASFPGWGLLMVSTQALLPMRQHCRALGEVILPDGTRRDWRWYDPEVFAALLPSLTPGQLDSVFANGVRVVVPSPSAWTWHVVEQGLLASTVRATMPAAR